MRRWQPLIIMALLGIAMGVLYGWLVDPVQYVDATPDSLRADYRADYVLMVAEAYDSEQDAALGARRLALLGSRPPGDIAAESVQRAREFGFAPHDIELMQHLTTAMQAWQPEATEPAP